MERIQDKQTNINFYIIILYIGIKNLYVVLCYTHANRHTNVTQGFFLNRSFLTGKIIPKKLIKHKLQTMIETHRT